MQSGERDRPEEKHKKQETNFIWLRNGYSANGDRTESATGSHRIMVFRGNRGRERKPHGCRSKTHRTGDPYAPAWILITLISIVIYYSTRGMRDNILHVATSYFMQKAVKHKRPRIVFDDSPAGCVLWQATRVRIFRAPQTFFKTRSRHHFLRNIKRESVRNGLVVSTQRYAFPHCTRNFCVRNFCRNFQSVFLYIVHGKRCRPPSFPPLPLCGWLDSTFVNILDSY